MKKLLSIVLGLMLIGTGLFADDYNYDYKQEDMIMPDGTTADVCFFKKWGDASKLANDKSIWEGKHSVLVKAKNDNELGYADIWHKCDDNENLQIIYNVMEEYSAAYAVAFVDFGNRIRRYVFTYKKGKIRNSFMDFFDESDEFYKKNSSK